MNPFELLGRYFWVLGLGVCVLQYVRSASHPLLATLEPEARRQIALYRNVTWAAQAAPWVVMGAGILTGGVRNIWGFFGLADGNPFVVAFFGLVALTSLSLTGWVFAGGARKVVELRLEEIVFSRRGGSTERGVKAMSALGVVGILGWVLMALNLDLPAGGRAAIPSGSGHVATDGYRLVFDVAHQGLTPWHMSLFGLAFVVAGLLFVRFREDLPMRGPEFVRKRFPFLWLGFAVLWTLLVSAQTYSTHRRLVTTLAEGRADVVEGEVTDFVPMPAGGHGVERFCVEQRCFSYSDYHITGAFNQTASHGGPIRSGLHVRVTYVGDDIVRLEVAAD